MDNNELVEKVARSIRKQAEYAEVHTHTEEQFQQEKPYWMDVAQAALAASGIAQLQAELAEAREQIAKYRSRLEIDFVYDLEGNRHPAPDDCYDGIYCRDATIEVLEDELDVVKGERRWRTMDSAPKDGTKILAWMVDRAEIRKGFPPAELDGPDVIYWSSCGNGWVSHRFGMPTGWMPLPAPPLALPAQESVEDQVANENRRAAESVL